MEDAENELGTVGANLDSYSVLVRGFQRSYKSKDMVVMVLHSL